MLLAERTTNAPISSSNCFGRRGCLARRQVGAVRDPFRFHLKVVALSVSHYGVPFMKQMYVGICGIAETTEAGLHSYWAFRDRL